MENDNNNNNKTKNNTTTKQFKQLKHVSSTIDVPFLINRYDWLLDAWKLSQRELGLHIYLQLFVKSFNEIALDSGRSILSKYVGGKSLDHLELKNENSRIGPTFGQDGMYFTILKDKQSKFDSRYLEKIFQQEVREWNSLRQEKFILGMFIVPCATIISYAGISAIVRSTPPLNDSTLVYGLTKDRVVIRKDNDVCNAVLVIGEQLNIVEHEILASTPIGSKLLSAHLQVHLINGYYHLSMRSCEFGSLFLNEETSKQSISFIPSRYYLYADNPLNSDQNNLNYYLQTKNEETGKIDILKLINQIYRERIPGIAQKLLVDISNSFSFEDLHKTENLLSFGHLPDILHVLIRQSKEHSPQIGNFAIAISKVLIEFLPRVLKFIWKDTNGSISIRKQRTIEIVELYFCDAKESTQRWKKALNSYLTFRSTQTLEGDLDDCFDFLNSSLCFQIYDRWKSLCGIELNNLSLKSTTPNSSSSSIWNLEFDFKTFDFKTIQFNVLHKEMKTYIQKQLQDAQFLLKSLSDHNGAQSIFSAFVLIDIANRIQNVKALEAANLFVRASAIFEERQNFQHSDYFWSVSRAAAIFRLQGKFYESLSGLNRVKHEGEVTIDYAEILYQRAYTFEIQGNYKEALDLLLSVLKTQERYPSEPEQKVLTFSRLASVLLKLGFSDQSIISRQLGREDIFVELLALQKFFSNCSDVLTICKTELDRKVEQRSKPWADYYEVLGMLQLNESKFSEALNSFTEARTILIKTVGEDDAEYIRSMINVASGEINSVKNETAKFELAKLDFGKGLLEDAQSKVGFKLGGRHYFNADILFNFGLYFEKRELWVDAISKYEEAVELLTLIFGKDNPHPQMANCLFHIAIAYEKLRQHSKAIPKLLLCKEIRQKAFGKRNLDFLQTLRRLAYSYAQDKQWAEALPVYQECREIAKIVHGEKHTTYIAAVQDVGSTLFNLGRYVESEKALLYCEELQRKYPEEGFPVNLAATQEKLIAIYKVLQMPGMEKRQTELLKIEQENRQTISMQINSNISSTFSGLDMSALETYWNDIFSGKSTNVSKSLESLPRIIEIKNELNRLNVNSMKFAAFEPSQRQVDFKYANPFEYDYFSTTKENANNTTSLETKPSTVSIPIHFADRFCGMVHVSFENNSQLLKEDFYVLMQLFDFRDPPVSFETIKAKNSDELKKFAKTSSSHFHAVTYIIWEAWKRHPRRRENEFNFRKTFQLNSENSSNIAEKYSTSSEFLWDFLRQFPDLIVLSPTMIGKAENQKQEETKNIARFATLKVEFDNNFIQIRLPLVLTRRSVLQNQFSMTTSVFVVISISKEKRYLLTDKILPQIDQTNKNSKLVQFNSTNSKLLLFDQEIATLFHQDSILDYSAWLLDGDVEVENDCFVGIVEKPKIGDKVFKIGGKSAMTNGKITDLFIRESFDTQSAIPTQFLAKGEISFVDFGFFSWSGDGGSAVFNGKKELIGMVCWSQQPPSSDKAIICPAKTILDSFAEIQK